MTIDIPITFTDIHNAYKRLYDIIDDVFTAQLRLNKLEAQKADIWAQLTSNPDFKPGRSNLEQAAKLRAANPLFMDEYEAAVAKFDSAKLQSDLANRQVAELKDMLSLGKILTAIPED